MYSPFGNGLMFRGGDFVADFVSPLDDQQIQPNGVDLTIDTIFEQNSAGRIDGRGKEIGDRRALGAAAPTDGPVVYDLPPGGYVMRYAETVTIPEGHIGFLYPRSSLLRNSCMLNTAVWDAGYEGRGEGLLEVHHPIELEAGARVAQLVLATADHTGTYDGTYQGENREPPAPTDDTAR